MGPARRIPSALAATTLIALAATWPAGAQVRRADRNAARPVAPAVSQPRIGVAQARGGARVGGNVNIGNDISVGRPRGPAVVAVPVYPGYESGLSVGALLATGVVAGVAGGLVAGALQDSGTPAAATATAPAANGTVLEIGTRLSALPSGCVTQQVSGRAYFRCGTAWLQGAMDGAQIVYVVVPLPT